ncbi:uncharacterized protein MELLADRAFT_60289 [Melampsora larici-populina 98AG31]|uniref:Uncharacterized protein n=1 Tax=Melampsora larici-populina (strain 98AG31 / pathotype 3-4-7) TaxID=747676 RepID=F4RAS8_MELLP|nr:uncharacterized protein MELLADRAFT_60289 [Melampsora larici-populina 98AG31]EGG10725.1 hypothetical protein MELLADRAFT_60289 [Melampsora larici-populina 98AG31]
MIDPNELQSLAFQVILEILEICGASSALGGKLNSCAYVYGAFEPEVNQIRYFSETTKPERLRWGIKAMENSDQQALVSRLLAAAPPGQNPFVNGIQALGEGSFPVVPTYSYHILIFFMVVYGAIALGALFLILFPLLKGPEMRKKHLWLWNKCYIGNTDTTPFYIPNNSLSVAVGLGTASSLCSPHRNFEEPKKSMRWLKIFTSPSVLNVFCILIPLLVTLKTIYWTIAQSVASERLWSQHDTVILLFDRAAKEWSPTVPINNSSQSMLELERVVTRHITLVHRLAVNVRIAGIQWNVSIFVLSLFYCLTTGALILLVRRSLKIASGKINILTGQRKTKHSDKPKSRPETETKSSITTVIMADQGSKAATTLQRGYSKLLAINIHSTCRYESDRASSSILTLIDLLNTIVHLTVQCLFLSLCLLFDLSTSFFFTTHAHLITKSGEWRIYKTEEAQQESQTYTVICVSPQESDNTPVQFKSPLREGGETDTSLESEDQYSGTRLNVSHVTRHHWSQDGGNRRMDPERTICESPHPPT